MHGIWIVLEISIIVVAAVYLGATNWTKVLSFEPMLDAFIMVHMEARQCEQLLSILVATQANHTLVLVILRFRSAFSATFISLFLHKFVFRQRVKQVLLQGSLTLLHMQFFHHINKLLSVHATMHSASAVAHSLWSKHLEHALATT